MRRLPVHRHSARFVARWEQRSQTVVKRFILLPVPSYELVNRSPAVDVHWHSTADFSAFYDTSIEKEIGDGGAVLVDITDGEAEEFGDASVCGDAEHEQSAVARFEGAVEGFGDFSDLVVVEGLVPFIFLLFLAYF
jgi:hypothetical protein